MYPQVFGKYVLEKELSRGGMARVILATLRGAGGFEKRLVVKQIRDELAFDQQFIRRFVEEAKTTVALSHPNIVPVYELGVEQGTYFLAMELVEGLSVGDLIAERNMDGSRRALTPEEGAYVGVEVCRALDYAHRRMKVVHRDITPRNVMIDEEGQIKLIDFGIAAPALVAGQEILGSPGHMAPEQVDGGELGPPTDIFAVAVLLMEAWTGTAPFRRATPEECAAAVREPHPRPSDFDPRLLPLDEPIARAMDVDPQKRQQEASDLARSLRHFLQGVDVADIARALGDRVRDVRSEATSLAPPSRMPAPLGATPSHGDGELGTQTFAAREEALSWSNPPAALPVGDVVDDDAPVPSTRRLDDPPVSTRALPDARRSPSREPKIVLVDDIPEPSTRALADAEPRKPVDVPTLRREKLVRPLDTSATKPVEVAPPPPRRNGLAFALVAIAAVGGFALWRSRTDSGPTTPPNPTTTTTTTATTPSAAPSASVAPPPPASTAPGESASAAPPPSASTSPSASPSVSAAAKANVAFLGEPGTRVAVDGAPRGPCPVRIALDPGRHDVRFTFDPTSESRSESFSLKSGEHVTVRAEFTGATPTVRIQR